MDVYELFQQIENRIAIAESVRMIGSKRADKADLSLRSTIKEKHGK